MVYVISEKVLGKEDIIKTVFFKDTFDHINRILGQIICQENIRDLIGRKSEG